MYVEWGAFVVLCVGAEYMQRGLCGSLPECIWIWVWVAKLVGSLQPKWKFFFPKWVLSQMGPTMCISIREAHIGISMGVC